MSLKENISFVVGSLCYVLEKFSRKSFNSCFTLQALKFYPFIGYICFCFWKLHMLLFTKIAAPGEDLIKADPTRIVFEQTFCISLTRYHALCNALCKIITKTPKSQPIEIMFCDKRKC